MVIPVLAVMFNILLTMRGNWSHVAIQRAAALHAHRLGAYIVVSFQGLADGAPRHEPAQLTSRSTCRPRDLGLLFFGASVCIGGAYYVIPRVLQLPLYSRRLARAQYAFYVIGFIAFFLGFVRRRRDPGVGLGARLGLPVWIVLPGLVPCFALRIMGGALLVISFMMFALQRHRDGGRPATVRGAGRGCDRRSCGADHRATSGR